MKTYNAKNERIKRLYLEFLKEAKHQSEASVDAAAKALARFEADTGYRDFKLFRVQEAIDFKRRLAAARNPKTGRGLSKATLYATLAHLTRIPSGSPCNRGTSRKFSTAMRTIFNCPRMRRASRPQSAPLKFPQWNGSGA